MTPTIHKTVTAEEFAQMPDPPDGSLQELVRGEIETMPPPGGLHGACCSRIDRRLGTQVDSQDLGTLCTNDTGFVSERNPDTVRAPDISFWSRARLPEIPVGYIEIPPDLAIEVISPNDHYSRILKKVRHHLNHGVRLVWVVDPIDRSVTVYHSLHQATILEETDIITGEEVIPGFSCKVGDFFP